MAQRIFPIAGDNLGEADYESIAAQWQDIGVIGTPGGTTLRVTAPGGMAVEIAAGDATIAGRGYENTATVTLSSIPTEDTLERIDWIVMTLDRNEPDGVLERIAGTPGAGAPSLTSPPAGLTYLPLAKVTIRAGATSIATSDIVDARWYVGARCQPVASNYLPTAAAGRLLYQYDTGRVLLGTASGWVEIVGPGSRAALGNVSGGILKYSNGSVILNTAAVSPSWADVSNLGQIVVPGTTGRLYVIEGRAPVTQSIGELAIRDAANKVLGQGGLASDGQVATVTVDYIGEGTAKTVKLSGRKKTGEALNLHLQGVSSAQPVVFKVTDTGITT